jgi:HD-like signal output (HDOD) protein
MTTALEALARLERLPSRAAAAQSVLRLVDDPDTGAADLAQVIGTDPAFAARVIRVANSSYFGMSSRVSTLPFAVSIIGFQAIRGLAVAAAAGLDGPNAAPAGFWLAATTAATAADLVAPTLGAHPGDAFCLGLLHTLGSALLHQHQQPATLCLPGPVEDADLTRHEIDIYGIGHADAAARVLTAWKFPQHLCTLIARHHEPVLPDATPLERVLPTARALTHLALTDQPRDNPSNDLTLARLTQGRLAHPELDTLIERIHERAAALHEALN